MTQEYLLITVNYPPITAEAINNMLFEEGAQMVWEDQPDDQGRMISKANFDLEQEMHLMVSLAKKLLQIANIFELPSTNFDLNFKIETMRDWSEKWKEGLEPIYIGNNELVISPTWWKQPISGKQIIYIDPGMAFGSGHHASTYLCLKALVEQTKQSQPKNILDLGSGSGILALAAAKLTNGSAKIIAFDNDPETITVAKENAIANNSEDTITFLTGQLIDTPDVFDLCLANITKNILLELSADISKLCHKKASLILSGILEEQTESILEQYNKFGWKLIQHFGKEEWSALLLHRDSKDAINETTIVPRSII